MRKTFYISLNTLLLLFGLTACGGGDPFMPDKDEKNTDDVEKPKEPEGPQGELTGEGTDETFVVNVGIDASPYNETVKKDALLIISLKRYNKNDPKKVAQFVDRRAINLAEGDIPTIFEVELKVQSFFEVYDEGDTLIPVEQAVYFFDFYIDIDNNEKMCGEDLKPDRS